MEERNGKEDPNILSAESDDEGATDIVGRTGEEMPLAMHDQGRKTFQPATPEEAFDPRLPNRRPKTPLE